MSRFRPSHGTVVAYAALFVALSGTALALKQGSVGPRAIKSGAVRTSKIADGAVTNPKLRDGSVTLGKIALGSVGGAQLADGAVLPGKIANDAVGSQQIVAGAVGAAKLKASSVSTPKIEDGAVTSAKLGPVLSLTIDPPAGIGPNGCATFVASAASAVAANRSLVPISTGTGWTDSLLVAGARGRGDGALIATVCNSTGGIVDGAPGEVTLLQL